MPDPTVSVLITTYNRSEMLVRCISRVLMQDFSDFEIVVIDDCSSDNTPQVMEQFQGDKRIRYIRNEQNVGGTLGDRAHIQRFVYELSRGKYWVYVCDDDYWLNKDLLSKQIKAYQEYPNLVMVVGGQLSYFIGENERPLEVTAENLGTFVDPVDFTSINPKVGFQPNVFPKYFMESNEYLQLFSNNPAGCNQIGGAILYNKAKFIESGAIASEVGSKWQAGFELVMGPGCYGDVVYLNEPCILAEIRQENASFERTQLEHYLDSVFSIELAFTKPLEDAADDAERRNFLLRVKRNTITNLSRSYLNNYLHIKRTGALTMCTEKNISEPVTFKHVWKAYKKNGVPFQKGDLKLAALTVLSPWLLKIWDRHRGRIYERG